MKVKVCPKCGSTNLGERWSSKGGRRLEQYCHGENDEYCNDDCSWVSEPYTPPKRPITNKVELRIDDFYGWHYQVFDRYGHIQTDSATHDSKAEAMKELTDDITPREGYDDPAAPYTAVLVKVPCRVTVEGTMFKLVNGKVTEVK